MVLLALPGLTNAQYDRKIDIQLEAYLQRAHAADAQVDLFVHGERVAVATAVLAMGGTVKSDRPDLVSARVPIGKVRTLAEEPAVRFFEFSLDEGVVLNDSMRVKNHVVQVHAGLPPLPDGYDGTGVVMGIIDSGMDWQHGDFKNADGTTRILKYWDQTLPINGQTPQPYNYGQVWTSAQIDAGMMTSIDQPAYNGHGSTVTGTAAGNGLANGRHKGVAPGADLIIVSASFGGNFRAKVADGVKYIFDEAAALGKPAVVNASLGSYSGSHDGQDAAALFIDDLLEEQGGRVMVCAAGNTGDPAQYQPYHLRTEVSADTTFTWFKYNANSSLGYGAVFFEVWGDIADLVNVHYAVGADRVSPALQYRGRTPFHTIAQNLGVVLSEPLMSPGGNLLAMVETYAVQRGGQYLLQVHMQTPDSNAYNFRFITTGAGKFDVWSSSILGTSNMVSIIPTVGEFPPIADYVMPDNNKHMVDSWACSSHVLTVANYVNEVSYVDYYGNPQTVTGTENDIRSTSSKGPTRDDRLKPDLAATGDITFSAAPLAILDAFISGTGDKVDPGGMHIRNGGTSMASPVVAGAAALYLQKCPLATHEEVMEAINSTTMSDAFTGVVPNNLWGNGKLNAFEALLTSNVEDFDLLVDGPGSFCDGSTVEVSGPDGMSSYEWSDGSTTNPLDFGEEGPLSLVVRNGSGCIAFSDTVSFIVHPLPPVPTITQDGELTLISSATEGNQWLLDGMPMDGQTGQVHVVGTSGEYQVQVTDGNGCSSISEPIQILVVGLEEELEGSLSLWPSPVRNELFVELPDTHSGTFTVEVFDTQGRTIMQRTMNASGRAVMSVEGWSSGTYTLRLTQGDQQWNARFVKTP